MWAPAVKVLGSLFGVLFQSYYAHAETVLITKQTCRRPRYFRFWHPRPGPTFEMGRSWRPRNAASALFATSGQHRPARSKASPPLQPTTASPNSPLVTTFFQRRSAKRSQAVRDNSRSLCRKHARSAAAMPGFTCTIRCLSSRSQMFPPAVRKSPAVCAAANTAHVLWLHFMPGTSHG